MYNRLILIFIVFFFLGGRAEAITLEDAVKTALSHSEQAEIIREKARQTMADARTATAFTLPQLDAVAEYHELDTNEEPNPYIPYPERKISARLEASQILWSGGRIWNSYDLRKQLETLAGLQERSGKASLVELVTNAYNTVLYQQALLKVATDRVQQRRDELQAATDLFEGGMVTNLDVREASMNLNLALGDLRAGESDFRTALVDFNLAIGQSPDETLLRPEGDLQRPEDLVGKKAQLEADLTEGRLRDIKTAELRFDTAETDYRLAGGEHWPAFLLVGSAETTGEEMSERDEYWSVGMRMQWDLYTGGDIASRTASARAKMASAQAQLAKTRKKLWGTVAKLDTEIDRLRRRIEIQEKSVLLSDQNYQDARALYGQGTMTLTRLGDFNLKFAEARFGLMRLYFIENQVSASISALIE